MRLLSRMHRYVHTGKKSRSNRTCTHNLFKSSTGKKNGLSMNY
jgi:hypothetical protein